MLLGGARCVVSIHSVIIATISLLGRTGLAVTMELECMSRLSFRNHSKGAKRFFRGATKGLDFKNNTTATSIKGARINQGG